jgi:uroporphyrinogen-III synthase
LDSAVIALSSHAVHCGAGRIVKRGKTGQFQAKIGEIGTKSQETCGNQGFSVDFTLPEVAW